MDDPQLTPTPNNNDAPATKHDDAVANTAQQQGRAADVARHQIDHIYDTAPPNQPKEQASTGKGVYDRTHQDTFDWSAYHSAWQQYYQEYYRRYYHHLNTKQTMAGAAQPKAVAGDDSKRVEALKQDIVSQVRRRAKNLKHSNHFVPIISAATVGLIFLFVQFNSVLIAQVQAYVSPGALEGQSTVVTNPITSINVGPDSRLIIPKINVDVPVNFEVTSLDENEIQAELQDAAVHYKLPGATAMPGEFGNNVILGHSSNDVFAQGQYKFAFVLADHLQAGDTFYIHYNSIRYTYKVTDKKVIKPTDLAALQIGYDKPMTTLVTCTPPGTAIDRLLIFAEQISPDPTQASKPIEQPAATEQEAPIPGNAPTLFERLWQLFF